MTSRHSSIICPYCKTTSTRWTKLIDHIKEAHPAQEVPEWISQQVGARRQQGLYGAIKKELCPTCGREYLKPCYVQTYPLNKLKWVKIGMVCPVKECSFFRKN